MDVLLISKSVENILIRITINIQPHLLISFWYGHIPLCGSHYDGLTGF